MGGGIQAKLDQTIQIQKSLKETSETILMKTEQNTEYCQLKEQIAGLQAKADQAITGQQELKKKADLLSVIEKDFGDKTGKILAEQQELSRKADHALTVQQELKDTAEHALTGQQELKKKADLLSVIEKDFGDRTGKILAEQQELGRKADHALTVQQELKDTAEHALTVQQELLKKTGLTLSTQQEFTKKADQALSGQEQLSETVAAAQALLDQISAKQKHCGNETEFARMSRTLFANFRYWEDSFYNAINGTDIEERYDRLVSGLSDKDRTVIDTMISRIQHLCEKGDKTCYMPDEAERIYRNKKESLRVVKLNDHCFVYRGYKLPINAFETSTFACNYGLDLIEHSEYADGKDIIDAGAYIGDSALVFDRYFSKCRRIYAFEPEQGSYSLMEKTIAMNRVENIIPVRLALGDANGDGELTIHGMGSNLLDRHREPGQGAQNVQAIKTVRLDDYVKQNNIVAGVIKTDLEGFEMHFLRGALETIKKDRPILVLSIYHSADDFFGIKPFIESLNLGYRFRLFKADDGMILGGTCLICIPES